MPVTDSNSQRKVLKPTIVVVVLVIIVMLALSWFLTRGVEDDQDDKHGIDSAPSESRDAANPNETGGRDGTGNSDDTSNDPGIQTPSPAGGVDTNDIPAGSTSP